jgi:hypothetical protein
LLFDAGVPADQLVISRIHGRFQIDEGAWLSAMSFRKAIRLSTAQIRFVENGFEKRWDNLLQAPWRHKCPKTIIGFL